MATSPLPAKSLLLLSNFFSAKTWEELYSEYSNRRGSVDWTSEPFKEWLNRAKGAQISIERIKEVVQGLDHIPREVNDLLKLCSESAIWRRKSEPAP
jgi:hypothetical protein